MGAALLHGDVGAAFAANPLALIAVVVLGLVAVVSVVEAGGGPPLTTSGTGRAGWLRAVPTWLWAALGTALGVGFTVARNLS